MTTSANDAFRTVDGSTRVFSLQTAALGNAVYARSLRKAFTGSAEVEFSSKWSNDEAELGARLVDRALRLHVPIPYVRKNDLDLWRVRADLGYAFKSRRLLRRFAPPDRYDVLHFHTQTLALLSTDLMRTTPSVITTDQTAYQGTREREIGAQRTHAPSERLEARAFRATAIVVAFSNWAARSLVDEHALPADRVRVIPPGVDIALFADIRRAAVPRASRRTRILFVGGDFRRKGGPLVVDVFLKHFATRGIELHLMTGERDIPNHPQIVVHRGVAAMSPEWNALYANADVFVLPTNHDAFGLALVEAMAAGLPVVGTNICAAPEIVVHGETGFLIERDDGTALRRSLETFVTDRGRAAQFGEAGVARVARLFDADRNAYSLGTVFQEAASMRAAVRYEGVADSAQ